MRKLAPTSFISGIVLGVSVPSLCYARYREAAHQDYLGATQGLAVAALATVLGLFAILVLNYGEPDA